MKRHVIIESESGFSLVELMISAAILLPLLGAVVLLFARGVDYYGAEQRTAQMNEEARMAVEVMSLEIAQAGARKDPVATLSAATAGSGAASTVNVSSSTGFSASDTITVDPGGGAAQEDVVLTGVGTNTLTGIFKNAHISGATVTLFALPYLTGIVPPAGMAANSSATATRLAFYGDFYENGDLYYIEYKYIPPALPVLGYITKSITKLDSGAESTAQVLIENVTGPASPFTLYSDANGAVTSVAVSLTLQSTWTKTTKTTQLASRMAAPSVAAASSLQTYNNANGQVYVLPVTPANVTTWSSN